MIYIYSNLDVHTDNTFAENVLKLGKPLLVLEESEYYKRIENSYLRNENGIIKFINIDTEKPDDNSNLEVSEIYRLDYISRKRYLKETDWISSKCKDENLEVSEAYPNEYKKRKQARIRINELEKMYPYFENMKMPWEVDYGNI